MRTVDLFAGCGGMSEGFQKAGFDLQAAFEFWTTAADCYQLNFSHDVFRMDLSDTEKAIEQIQQYSPELIIGGPPCQDFSHAGKRQEADRASLTFSFSEIIHTVRPSYFVMENVDRAQKSRAYQKARDVFRASGYGITEVILDASRCGVPQKRKRFFCIGGLNQQDGFLSERLEQGLSARDMTLRDYFGNALDFEFYYRHPRNYSRRAIFSIDEPAPTMRGVNRPIPKGYPGHPKDACLLNQPIHVLSTLERSLIQTFPPNYKWCGNKTDMEQMIGNAVPVNLAYYVASVLKKYVDSVSMENTLLTDGDSLIYQDFRSWLVSHHGLSMRTTSDIASRVRRVNRLRPMKSETAHSYLSNLQHDASYLKLSASVSSQLKRAVMLYADYISSREREMLYAH